MDNIAKKYDEQVNPFLHEYIDPKTNKKRQKWMNNRADKETRYAHFYEHQKVSLDIKERWAIDLLKVGLKRSKKPVVSCSFGIDSIVSLYLTRKALKELGRDPSDIDVVWNDTKNEFLDVRKFAKYITDLWNLRLITTSPKKVLKKVIEDHGGVTEDYFFARKGDRRKNKRPLSEKCCEVLKHEPMKRARNSYNWDLVIVGLRADESNQRFLAALRDGELFYSGAEWSALVCRPILWWLEAEVWEYVDKNNIPYSALYDKNLIQKYPDNVSEIINNNKEKLLEVGIDVDKLYEQQLKTVTRKQYFVLRDLGFKIFAPRTGCQLCPITVKYGYLHWVREFYPKAYNAMVHHLGYGKVLLSMISNEKKEEIKELTGIDVTEENAHEYLQDILNAKPCIFDEFN